MGFIKALIPLFLIAFQLHATTITVVDPPQLAQTFKKQPFPMHVTPIGFRPLSGRLNGKVVMANPTGACSMIDDVHSMEDDIFILADDSECLQSVKAKNIANSGGYVGIIRQNIENTLHDKQINLVHIPIVELSTEHFDMLAQYIKDNQNTTITLSLDFTQRTLTHNINLQVWFSPTQASSYQFILGIKDFIDEQKEDIKFSPHYVLQSQREAKNYIGCFSSGKYCPSQIQFQGKYEGMNIVDESLRQIILWKMSSDTWWTYFTNFYKSCIQQYPQIFMNSTQLHFCSQNAMIMSGVDIPAYRKQYNNSFQGGRREVSDNTYLLEERQHYIKEQITEHPIGLINKKPIALNLQVVQNKICKIQGEKESGPCKTQHKLSTVQVLIVVFVMFVVFVGVAALYRLYIYISMRRQIKGEVDKTLEQYYRYIQTFQGADGQIGSKNKPTRQKSRQLGQDLQQIEEKRDIQMELSDMKGK